MAEQIIMKTSLKIKEKKVEDSLNTQCNKNKMMSLQILFGLQRKIHSQIIIWEEGIIDNKMKDKVHQDSRNSSRIISIIFHLHSFKIMIIQKNKFCKEHFQILKNLW